MLNDSFNSAGLFQKCRLIFRQMEIHQDLYHKTVPAAFHLEKVCYLFILINNPLCISHLKQDHKGSEYKKRQNIEEVADKCYSTTPGSCFRQ